MARSILAEVHPQPNAAPRAELPLQSESIPSEAEQHNYRCAICEGPHDDGECLPPWAESGDSEDPGIPKY